MKALFCLLFLSELCLAMKPNFNPHKYFKKLMLIYGQPTVFGCMTVQAEKQRTSISLSAVQSYDHTVENNSACNTVKKINPNDTRNLDSRIK